MSNELELTLLNQPSEVSRMQNELESFARQHGLASRAVHDVQLALEEHLTNILSHAFADSGEHRICVRVEFEAPDLRVTVEDDGRPFNPLEHPTPDLSKPLEARPIGGLGIHMMKKSMDHLEYRRIADKNVLAIIKSFRTPAP